LANVRETIAGDGQKRFGFFSLQFREPLENGV